MQTDERPMVDERMNNRWRGPVIGIAAAAVVLIAGLIYVSTDREPVAEPAPNAVAIPGGDFPSLAPGAYYVDTDGDAGTSTRGTFVIEGDGWASAFGTGAVKEAPGGSIEGGSYVMLTVGEVDQVWEAPCAGGTAVSAGTTAKALGDQFAAMPAFFTIEGLTPVTAFGHDGFHLVLEVPASCSASESYNVWSSPTWGERFYQVEGQIVEYWFLDVEGATVMVEATRPPESTQEPLMELEADLDTVLDTLVLTP
jgi:hypothetical protein